MCQRLDTTAACKDRRIERIESQNGLTRVLARKEEEASSQVSKVSRANGSPLPATPSISVMKVKGSLRRLCAHCKVVRRGKAVFVICSETPRHKQRQGFHTLITTSLQAGGSPSAAEGDAANSCSSECECGCGRNGKVTGVHRLALPELR